MKEYDMVETCIKYREMRNAYTILVEKHEGKKLGQLLKVK
jgi:hypothetical protein